MPASSRTWGVEAGTVHAEHVDSPWETAVVAFDPYAPYGPVIDCLNEAWETSDDSQTARVGSALGLEHRTSVCGFALDGWRSGIGICSR